MGRRGGAEAGMGAGELVESCIGIKVQGAWGHRAAQHTLRREAHFNRYN